MHIPRSNIVTQLLPIQASDQLLAPLGWGGGLISTAYVRACPLSIEFRKEYRTNGKHYTYQRESGPTCWAGKVVIRR